MPWIATPSAAALIQGLAAQAQHMMFAPLPREWAQRRSSQNRLATLRLDASQRTAIQCIRGVHRTTVRRYANRGGVRRQA